MSTTSPGTPSQPPDPEHPPGHHEDPGAVDWDAAAGSPEFEELQTKTKAFVYPAVAFFLFWYLGFIVLAGYAPGFMGRRFLTDGLTVGYVIAISQFVMVWVLAGLYRRISLSTFDGLRAAAAAAAVPKGSAAARTVPGEGPK